MPLAAWPVVVALLLGPPDAEGWRSHVATLSAAGDAESALRLASGLGRRGETAEARRFAAIARERGAHPIRVTLALAETALRAEDWAVAASGYYEVLQSAPEHGYAAVQLWHCLRMAPPLALSRELDVARLRGVLDARGFYVPEVFQYPPDLQAAAMRVSEGFAAITRNEYDAARRAFRAAIDAAPSFHDAWRGLGMVEAARGNAAGTRSAYLVFLALEPPESIETRRIRRMLSDDARRRGLAAEKEKASARRSPGSSP